MTLAENTFIGEYSYTIDSKGRLNIPSRFRKSLSENDANTFVITKGLDPCIWVYPLTEWLKIENNLRNLSSVKNINRTFVRHTTRYASSSTYDKQGRVLLTPSLVDYASIDKEVLIIGAIGKIEIWNPEKLQEVDKQNMKIEQDAYDELADKITL
ncbi:MAG: division/cell wall cluster transcriptional repressor MraZ [Candidatus Marinimicrobia bacterium]|nr:division/cell wall cluster transcriptional repressor MraZ [Candidatus Neomarinimicrobiota bacterium]|tara:strand:- start:1650 stop:2114 length:465 start_codon:yes stop_codon:yes gene_type:complete